jgi:hypothetical protein
MAALNGSAPRRVNSLVWARMSHPTAERGDALIRNTSRWRTDQMST